MSLGRPATAGGAAAGLPSPAAGTGHALCPAQYTDAPPMDPHVKEKVEAATIMSCLCSQPN
eukprot:16433125-Heterocapsa_arctica.AAC.1